jgi:putative endopeptidase
MMIRRLSEVSISRHQVLSENIADLASLAAAYDAYHLSLNGQPAHDQDFFVGYAQSWLNKSREERIRLQVTTDGHSPDEYRVATVRNLDPWYAAFNVTPPSDSWGPSECRAGV